MRRAPNTRYSIASRPHTSRNIAAKMFAFCSGRAVDGVVEPQTRNCEQSIGGVEFHTRGGHPARVDAANCAAGGRSLTRSSFTVASRSAALIKPACIKDRDRPLCYTRLKCTVKVHSSSAAGSQCVVSNRSVSSWMSHANMTALSTIAVSIGTSTPSEPPSAVCLSKVCCTPACNSLRSDPYILLFECQRIATNQRTRMLLADGSWWEYRYDALGQVVSGKRYWADGTPVAGQQFEYGFDDIGNRKSTAGGGDKDGSGLRTATYTANRLNQNMGTDKMLSGSSRRRLGQIRGQTRCSRAFTSIDCFSGLTSAATVSAPVNCRSCGRKSADPII